MGELSTILAAVESLKGVVRNTERCKVRASEVLDGLSLNFRYYSDLHQTKVLQRKQSLITRFIRQPSSPAVEAEAGPSDEGQPPLSPGHLFTEEDVTEFEGFMQHVEEQQVAGMTDDESSEDSPDGEPH